MARNKEVDQMNNEQYLLWAKEVADQEYDGKLSRLIRAINTTPELTSDI